MQTLKLNTRLSNQSWLGDEEDSDDEDPFAEVNLFIMIFDIFSFIFCRLMRILLRTITKQTFNETNMLDFVLKLISF